MRSCSVNVDRQERCYQAVCGTLCRQLVERRMLTKAFRVICLGLGFVMPSPQPMRCCFLRLDFSQCLLQLYTSTAV